MENLEDEGVFGETEGGDVIGICALTKVVEEG